MLSSYSFHEALNTTRLLSFSECIDINKAVFFTANSGVRINRYMMKSGGVIRLQISMTKQPRHSVRSTWFSFACATSSHFVYLVSEVVQRVPPRLINLWCAYLMIFSLNNYHILNHELTYDMARIHDHLSCLNAINKYIKHLWVTRIAGTWEGVLITKTKTQTDGQTKAWTAGSVPSTFEPLREELFCLRTTLA